MTFLFLFHDVMQSLIFLGNSTHHAVDRQSTSLVQQRCNTAGSDRRSAKITPLVPL
jgi:hypothetical protein